ncbi:MAG: tRNA lysidine(34) synthetase TilS [Gammaproteobacteria bacterium]
MSFSLPRLSEALRCLSGIPPQPRICVALSGGVDSMVLIHALAALYRQGDIAGLRAIHVDHGLHPDSASWAQACERECAALRLELKQFQVQVPRRRGESLEAAARAVRYAALAEGLQPEECLATAHHSDDQMETVLLQLLRGSGPAGLAAMPAVSDFADGWLIRPLLNFSRVELELWARQQDLTWQQDPSNRDPGPRRNYLRIAVIPGLRERWPAAAASVGRSAAHCAEASMLLEELAGIDLSRLATDDSLDAVALAKLSEARQRNVLRAWLRQRGMPLPGFRRLQSAIQQLVPARRDANPEVRWPGGALRKYRQRIYALDAAQLRQFEREPAPLVWSDPKRPQDLGPGFGRLVWFREAGGGIDQRWLEGTLQIRFRHEGERVLPLGGEHHRRLKSLFQECGIAPWQRDRAPLVFAQNQLLAIADRWLAPKALAAPGQAGWRIRRELPPPGV